ncbi:hypothetical protein [Clostridium grantii]|uniref:Uncharacterized protein n=1 Tax=Clostridium grantii DSM 8605 TaxID=1121316 RepID=A0A1M5XNW7_9CLOT|nr:hypothetical protein [Clostridium grantii]SHI00923.1 hypothetical protein SAMN02745207_03779 [Clostridium grantii DSM 8605]
MKTEDLKVIDIRRYTGSKSKIVSYENNEIIFTKENQIHNKYYYSINKYNVKTDFLEEIYKYETPPYEYTCQYISTQGEDIVIIKMHFTYKVEVDIVHKISGKLKSRHCFETKEEVTSIPILEKRIS